MGVNSNFDNSFLQPSLPPPQAPLDENVQKESFKEKKAASQRDGGQSSGTVEGQVQDKSQVQNQGDDGDFSFKEALDQLVGKGKVSEGRNVAHVSVEGQTQVLSRDEIIQIDTSLQYKDKYNLADAFSSKDFSNLKPDSPVIPNGRMDVDAAGNVLKELSGNPWLNTSFMTSLVENLMEVVRIKMEQQVIEGKIGVQLLKMIGDLGVALGDLAMEKAKLEAEMHKWQAVAAIMGGTMAIGAGMISMAGTGAAAAAGGIKASAAAKNPATSGTAGAAGGSSKVGNTTATSTTASTSTWTRGSSPTAPPTTSTASTSTASTSSTTSAGGRTGVTIGENRSPIMGSRAQRAVRTDSSTSTSSTPWQKGATKTELNAATSTQKSAVEKPTVSAETGRTGWFGNLKSKFGFKSRAAGLDADGAPPVGADAKRVQRAEYIEKGGEMAGSLGYSLTQASSQYASAADNLIQAHWKILIGEVERDTQIMQSQKQIVEKSLDSAMNDLRDASQGIDGALKTLRDAQEATNRAHSFGR